MAEPAITPEQAQRWHDERRRGIGGSDMGDLFGVSGPFGGCTRRLWYDKAGWAPDVPRVQTDQMLRGKMLEAAAAQQYALDTGRKLLAYSRPRTHAIYTWARVNVDRGIAQVPGHRGRGVLEIKTQNAWKFRTTRRAGLAEAYVLQIQHAMFVTGATWGAFMVLHPDSWQRAFFDVDADLEIHEAIRRRGEEFWPRVQQGGPMPEKLPADDVRCATCPWRVTCQGVERLMVAAGVSEEQQREPVPRDESFAELIEDYDAAARAVAEAADLKDKIAEAIRAKMGDAEAVECQGGRIYYRPQQNTRLDSQRLKAEAPDVWARYAKTSETRPLRVYALPGGTTDVD